MKMKRRSFLAGICLAAASIYQPSIAKGLAPKEIPTPEDLRFSITNPYTFEQEDYRLELVDILAKQISDDVDNGILDDLKTAYRMVKV